MRIMYDSVTASAIPTDAEMVAGYVDGRYKWSEEDWNRFPHAVKVKIAVSSGTNEGTVLDVEPGNATAGGAVDWVLMRRREGIEPTIYCAISEWQSIRQAFANRRVTEPHYWIANWDGHQDVPSGAIAHQYINTPHYDISAVEDYWPGVDAKPEEKKAAPTPAEEPAKEPTPAPAPAVITQSEANALVDACNAFIKLIQGISDNLKV